MKTNSKEKLSKDKEKFWQQHELVLSTFSYWKKKLNSEKEQKTYSYPLTVPIQHPAVSSVSQSGTAGTAILLQDGQDRFHIEVTEDFSVTCLRKVLSAFEKR